MALAQAQLGQWEKAQENLVQALNYKTEAKLSLIDRALQSILVSWRPTHISLTWLSSQGSYTGLLSMEKHGKSISILLYLFLGLETFVSCTKTSGKVWGNIAVQFLYEILYDCTFYVLVDTTVISHCVICCHEELSSVVEYALVGSYIPQRLF